MDLLKLVEVLLMGITVVFIVSKLALFCSMLTVRIFGHNIVAG